MYKVADIALGWHRVNTYLLLVLGPTCVLAVQQHLNDKHRNT